MAGHLFVLGIWFVLWTVFYGWGRLLARVARCDRDDKVSLWIAPWLGMSEIIGTLQVWNLFAPVNAWSCWIICGIGILATAINIRSLSQILVAVRQAPFLSALFFLLVVWLANRSLNDMPPYTDQGLYYINTIRWQSENAIVPGLANLHVRFGFNNASFLLHAMLEHITGRGFSAHVLNGLLAAMALPIIFDGFRAIFRGSSNERQTGWFTLCLAMLVATAAIDGRIYSTTPDLPAGLMITIAVWRLLAIAGSDLESQGKLLRWNLLAIAVLAGAGVAVKTHVMFFAAFAGIALLAVIYRLNRKAAARPLFATSSMIGFLVFWSAIFIVPWMVRGCILTGYPLFPSTIGGLPVDWRFNEEVAVNLRLIYHEFERAPVFNPEVAFAPGWGWVPGWFVQIILLRGPVEIVLPGLIVGASFLWLAWQWVGGRPGNRMPQSTGQSAVIETGSLLSFAAWLLVAAYLAALAVWFLTAPSVRFGLFIMWGLAPVSLGLVSRTPLGAWTANHRKLVLAALIGLLLLPMVDEAARLELRYRRNPEDAMYGQHFYRFYPVVWIKGNGFPEQPKGEIVEKKTKSGLTVYEAAPLKNGLPGLLWDSPLPAARFFNPDLELRRPGDLSSGFKTLHYGERLNPADPRPRRWINAEPRETPEGTNEYRYPDPPPK